MNAYQVLRRLHAFDKGRALPRGETLHFPIAKNEDVLILVFVRMGGESAAWGIAFGTAGGKPTVLTVPEPRNRDLAADMMAEFASTFLAHVFHPRHSELQIGAAETPRPLRQIWLPNATHLEMLHLLEYAYARTKFGEAERSKLLRTFGRACGWVFRESQRAGQVLTMVATDALRESYTFPAEDTRLGHLGFLLAWLEGKGGRDAHIRAAAEAERNAIATSLEPAYEREKLQPLVDQYNEARSTSRTRDIDRLAGQIHDALKPELQRRFALVEQTIAHLREDGRRANEGLRQLVRVANGEHWYQYLRLEYNIDDKDDGPAFFPSAETDRHPAAASSRYYIHESSAEMREDVLLHDDRELQAEAVAAGDAILGTITEVSDEGEGKTTVPVWVVECASDLPLRLREGAELCVVGLAKRKGRIRDFGRSPSSGTQFEIEITSLKTAGGKDLPRGTRAANDRKLRGTRVLFVKSSGDGIARRKSGKVWAKGLPGSWLTLRRPSGVRADLPEGVAEDLDELQKKLGLS